MWSGKRSNHNQLFVIRQWVSTRAAWRSSSALEGSASSLPTDAMASTTVGTARTRTRLVVTVRQMKVAAVSRHLPFWEEGGRGNVPKLSRIKQTNWLKHLAGYSVGIIAHPPPLNPFPFLSLIPRLGSSLDHNIAASG